MAILAVLLVLAVNWVSGGALSFLTDWPNCLATVAVIGLIIFLIFLRRKNSSFTADEIESIAEKAGMEKQD